MRRVLFAMFVVVLIVLSYSAVAASEPATVVSTAVVVADTTEPVPVGVVAAAFAQLAFIFKAIQKGDIMGVLIVLCNMFVALLKKPWVEKRLAVLLKSAKWGKRTKVFFAFFAGFGLTYLFFGQLPWVKFIWKSLVVSLSSIGLYSVYKHFVRGEKV